MPVARLLTGMCKNSHQRLFFSIMSTSTHIDTSSSSDVAPIAVKIGNDCVSAREVQMKFIQPTQCPAHILETEKLDIKEFHEKCPSSFANCHNFEEIANEIDTFIFDADGVLWLGDSVINGSPKLIEYLIRHNKRVIVLTNNATKSRAVYAKKLTKLGYNSKLSKDSIVNPSAVIADMLYRNGLAGNKKVYMIGSQGIRDEMDELGIEYFGHGPEPQDHSDGSAFMFDIALEEHPENVGAVVVGYEKHFNYHKLMKASNYLRNSNCMFVATNEDETCPGPNPSVIIPDAGPLVAAVRCATGREPTTAGKPNTSSFEYIQRRWKINPSRTMMIGDRTNTDVKFGRDHGLKTMLVLSGCHQTTDILDNHENDRYDMVPDYYAVNLGSLVPKRNLA